MLYEYMENRANVDQAAEGLWLKARREKCESRQSLSALQGSARKQVHLTSLNNPHWSSLHLAMRARRWQHRGISWLPQFKDTRDTTAGNRTRSDVNRSLMWQGQCGTAVRTQYNCQLFLVVRSTQALWIYCLANELGRSVQQVATIKNLQLPSF